MLMPSIFGEDLFDEFYEMIFRFIDDNAGQQDREEAVWTPWHRT